MAIISSDREVRILTKNMVDSDSTFVLSHGGTAADLYDRDREKQYVTSGAARDSIAVTIEVRFNVGTTETEFTFNSLMMFNTNTKRFLFEYWKNSAWVKAFEGTLSDNYWCSTFGAIKSSRVRLTIYDTKIKANEEKKIGELIVARQRYAMTYNPVSYDMGYRQKMVTIPLADGQRHVAYTRFSTNRINKYGCRASFNRIPQADVDFLECLKNEGAPFLFYPESKQRPDQIFLVNWVNAFMPKYSIHYKGAGYDLTIELEEV